MQETNQEKSPIKRNILLYLKSKGVIPNDFYNASGVTRGVLGQNNGISEANLARFLAYAPDVNIEWLITGEGEMIKRSNSFDPELEVVPLHHPRAIERKHETQTIFIYDLEASAGVFSLDPNSSNIVDVLQIPNLSKCDGAIFVTGNSMQPILQSGDLVAYKQQSIKDNAILYGEMYIVSFMHDGDSFVVCKYIHKSPKGWPYIILTSENPRYADQEIDAREVNGLGLIKASLRYHFR